MTVQIEAARSFIASLDVPESDIVAQGDDAVEENPFSAVKDQATVVGQNIVAFMSGTEAQWREAISNSSLLAQLVADRRVPDKTKVYEWYDAYFEVLRNIGWAVQDAGWAEFSESGDGFEVHEKIIDVATVLLAPAPAALLVVKATLNALKGMNNDSPWITLFNRESTHAEAARFQINVVQPAAGGGLLVSMVAFGIMASNTITQVLFFKVKKNRARLRSNSAQVSINVAALTDLLPDINAKVRTWQRSYIKNLPDF